MFLRDHPLSTYRGVLAGHPLGRGRGGSDNKHPGGEIGILKDVLPSNIEPADRCVLSSTILAHPISDAFKSITTFSAVK